MLRVMRQQQHLMVMIVVNGIHMRCCACYILTCYIYIYAGLLRDVLSGEWMSLPVAKHPDRPQVGHH
jgi:hypothetical protein